MYILNLFLFKGGECRSCPQASSSPTDLFSRQSWHACPVRSPKNSWFLMRSIIFRLLSWPRISYAITIYRPFLFSLFKNQVSLSKHLFTDSDIKPSKDASHIKVKIIDFFLNYIVDPKGIEPSTLSLQGRNASLGTCEPKIKKSIYFHH